VESEGRQMKQCWIQYIEEKEKKIQLFKKKEKKMLRLFFPFLELWKAQSSVHQGVYTHFLLIKSWALQPKG